MTNHHHHKTHRPQAFLFSSQAEPATDSSSPSPTELHYHHISNNTPQSDHRPKFKSPRKLSNILWSEIQSEAIEKSKALRPEVWSTQFKVGDAIELTLIAQGGVDNTSETEKIRGVVLGKTRRGLDSSVMLRDVVFGEAIERKIPLHSPLVLSVKVLEENFVKKGKKKIKRAKLYYLRDRPNDETRVTKW